MCGRSFCPHVAKAESMFKVKDKLISSEFSGTSPAPFVGRYGYPSVSVGILAPPERSESAWEHDAPKHWSVSGYTIPQIIDLRSSLVNSRFASHVKGTGKMLDIAQEIGIASKPVDVDISLKDRPRFRLSSINDAAPTGPNAMLKSAQIVSNPKVHTKVDKVTSDTDLKARDALVYLYEHQFDENFLTRVLSVGKLGIDRGRKLVPTRWSITAVDDTLGEHLREDILGLAQVSDHMAYFGSYLGNYYLVMIFPDAWSYELFEMYQPKASWNVSDSVSFMTDYESACGRKSYAENCTGGYYSVRLAVLERLKSLHRQASALVIRVITGEYAAPLGVWVTREAARKALAAAPLRFSSKELLQNYALALLRKKFGFDAGPILRQSMLLKLARTQTKLSQFS
jgi:DNA repair protein NreA